MGAFSDIKDKLKKSKFFKDSFWAVFGNGLGNGLLLLSGIIVARLLGSNLYGEYGVVKTTMFQLAAFSTLGIGFTSTKFISQYRSKDPSCLYGIINASVRITLVSSCVLAFVILIGADKLAAFVNAPSLASAFRTLGVLVIIRAMVTTASGIMGGFGDFKSLAHCNILSGCLMFLSCIPLTYYLGVHGSLLALTLSQTFLCVLVCRMVYKYHKENKGRLNYSFLRPILTFSVPVGLQEFTYALSNWLGILIITKYSSLHEVGIYTASTMWGAVVLIIPTLLYNVMLSHLSHDTFDKSNHKKKVNIMLIINLLCTLLPFLAVFVLTPWIVSFYGDSFAPMQSVLRVVVFTTIFSCCSNVIGTELLAQGRSWSLFGIRSFRDALSVVLGLFLIICNNGEHAALLFAFIMLLCYIIYLFLLYIYYRVFVLRQTGQDVAN